MVNPMGSRAERSADQISFDPMFRSMYLGVREEIINGQKVATVIHFGKDRDAVQTVLRANKAINPSGVYRLYDPLEKGKIRKGLVIGGNE